VTFTPVLTRGQIRLKSTFTYNDASDDKVWLPLESRASDKIPVFDDLDFGERWLLDNVKSRIQGVESAEVVTKITVRNDGANRAVTSERGLEVSGSSEALTLVRTFFDRFTAGSKRVVTVEARVYSVGDEPEWTDATSVAETATQEDLENRIKDLVAHDAGRLLLKRTAKSFANQTARISVVEQVAYIKDYDVSVVSGERIADPLIGIVNDGFELELTPVLDPDSGTLTVSGSIGFSHVTRPIREHVAKIADTEVKVQLPEVVSRRWNGDVGLESGQGAIRIAGLKSVPGGSDRLQNVEVWCLVTIEGEDTTKAAGEIVDRDEKHGNIFVRFPRESVPDDPWNHAPKEVTVFRRGEKIGTAHLAGGWMLGEDPDSEHGVIAIYHLAEGTPFDGDSVR
jgi:hypothetical protein